MNVVAGAFLYTAELAVGQLQALGASPGVYSTWCGMIATKKRNGDLKHFRRMYDKKVRTAPDCLTPPHTAGAPPDPASRTCQPPPDTLRRMIVRHFKP